MSINWDGKNMLNSGQRGSHSSFADMIQKSQGQMEMVQKSAEMFQKMKPILMKALEQRIQSRTPIKVLQPIQIVVERIAKSAEKASVSIGSDVIPSGLELIFDGLELSQLFFKSFRNGQEVGEYSIHLGENIVIGNQQVARNTGLMGLLTKTDVLTEVLEMLKQR